MKEFEELLNDLRNKIYKPIYFLMGEEPYYIDLITDFIAKNVLNEAEKSFNQSVFYGKDSDVMKIIENARRFPMMANQQVVIIKEAQELKEIDKLVFYVEKPAPSTILVINYKYGTLDKRTKLYKALDKHVVLESKKIYDNQVPDWITVYLKKLKIDIEPEAAILLNEALGNNLSKITHEIEKLLLVIGTGSKLINRSHIEKNIGISKEYNNFELTKALGQKNVLKANKIVNYFEHNPKSAPFPVTITVLFSYFCKLLTYHYVPDKSNRNLVAASLGVKPFLLSEYENAARKYSTAKLAEIVSYLREYDLKSKGVGSGNLSDGELLKELVYRILH